MKTPALKKPIVRKLCCAVYTRKSSEEGLDMEFNSLDAQREACEAYIASQRPEGWTLVPDRYDDGGFSGGNVGAARAAAIDRRHRSETGRRRCRLQDRPALPLADGLRQAGRGIRSQQRHLRERDPVIQHDNVDGTPEKIISPWRRAVAAMATSAKPGALPRPRARSDRAPAISAVAASKGSTRSA